MPRIVSGRRGGGNRRTGLSHSAFVLLKRIAEYEVRKQRRPLLAEMVDISVGSLDVMRFLVSRQLVQAYEGRVRVTRFGHEALRGHRGAV